MQRDRGETDDENRERRVRQQDDEHGGDERRGGSDAQAKRGAGDSGAVRSPRAKRAHTKAAVIAQAVSHAGSILAANELPRLRVAAQHEQVGEVRARKQQRRGVCHEDCAVEERALVEVRVARGVQSTGVRNTTAVSRLSTAVTAATSASSPAEQAAGAEPGAGEPRPGASNRPSAAATPPIRSSPATSTNGGQTCPADARIACVSTLNSKAD